MATVYGVNKTKYLNPIGESLVQSGVNKGQVCFMYDTYEASALAATSVIELCDKIPQNAVLTRIVILTDDLGTGLTIDVGDSADDDRYASAIDVASAALTTIIPETAAGADIAVWPYEVGQASGDNQLTITINTQAATGTIKVGLYYAI